VIVLNKADMADPTRTREWLKWYAGQGVPAVEFVATQRQGRENLLKMMQQAAEEKDAGKAAYIEITHTTDNEFEYVQFADGIYIDNDKYTLGNYVLEYDDGTKAEIPIIYGWNFSSGNLDWDRKESERLDAFNYENRLFEVASTSRPVRINGTTWYRFITANPHPGKIVKGVYLNNRHGDKNIYIKDIKFI
jgi:hypothetical protein